MKSKLSLKKIIEDCENDDAPKINEFLLKATKGFNRTIGWNTRPIETYSINYLYRFEIIEDYIHLTNAIASIRNIPVATFDRDSAKRIESKPDNPYNWLRIHDSLANMENERARIGKEIEMELENLSAMLDSISEDLRTLVGE
jgi:hypothetical protein